MFSTAYRPGQCGFHCHSAYAVPICLLHWATWCVEPDGNVTYVLKFYVSKFHKSILIFRPVHSSTRGVFLTLSSLSNGETLFYVLVQTSPFIRIGFVPSKKKWIKNRKIITIITNCRSWIYTVKTGLPVCSVERINTQTWYRSLWSFSNIGIMVCCVERIHSPLIDWLFVFNGLWTAKVI